MSGVEGYHHFTDIYYSSVCFAQELNNQKCHSTNTIIASRKFAIQNWQGMAAM
jgi:hypothetical protein